MSQQFWRRLSQAFFVLASLWIGYQFYQFYLYLEGTGPAASRPPGVEGYLPIAALVGLKYWLTTGNWDPVHPAGLTLLLFFLAISWLLHKAFCSWICPIGSLFESVSWLGRKLGLPGHKQPWPRRHLVLKILDWLLRSIKYILMIFFLYYILLGMSGEELAAYLQTPYMALADVAMLQFFLSPGTVFLTVVGIFLLGSLFGTNLWCRYLCPYGALMGVMGILGLSRIQRDSNSCINCQACNRACPNWLPVAESRRVHSPDCHLCLQCVSACPVPGTLKPGFWSRFTGKEAMTVAVLVLGLFLLVYVVARLTGHWDNGLSIDFYRQMRAFYTGHP